MRFLNTSTRLFEHVADSELDDADSRSKYQYAVLSHRWSQNAEDEVSFPDISESKDVSHKKGFAKLLRFGEKAEELGCKYGWDDTCCINKGNSSELTESINSMYRWYQNGHICICYLEDVPEKSIEDSVWFERGWTLQELIGPKEAFFYDRDWNRIGTKTQRMSWAAKRITTRIEDRASSPLGLFDVSMPQIYGEREKAFQRLQRAIIQQEKNETIFAWEMAAEEERKPDTGLFATSPDSFRNCSKIEKTPGSTGFDEKNGELAISLKTFPYSMETYAAVLSCTQRTSSGGNIAIFLARLSDENEYVRVDRTFADGTRLVPTSRVQSVKVRPIRVPLNIAEPPLNRAYGFYLRTIEPPGHADCHSQILSKSKQSPADRVCLDTDDWGTAGVVYLAPKVQSGSKYNADQRMVESLVDQAGI